MGKLIWEGVIRDLKKGSRALFNSMRGYLSVVVWGTLFWKDWGQRSPVSNSAFIDNFLSRLSLFSYFLNVTVSKIH